MALERDTALVELVEILVALHEKLTDDLIRSAHISLQCLIFPRVTSAGRANGQTGGSYRRPRECVVASELLADLDLRGTLLRERPELREHRGQGPGPLTLARCDLSGADLRGLDLPGWAFHDCNLDEARLTGARLDSAVFQGGSARSATFIDADLAGARFEMVDATGAHFGGALMSEAQFHGCRLMGTNFEGTRGLGMLLQDSNLYAANLGGAALGNAALTGLRLTEASLRGADLRGSDLSGSVLVGADLFAAKLKNADLRGADLGPVDLDRLRALSGAIISRTQAEAILVELANVVVTD